MSQPAHRDDATVNNSVGIPDAEGVSIETDLMCIRIRARWVLVGGLVVAAAFGGAVWFVAAHGFSARARPSSFEAFLAKRLRRIAEPAGTRTLRNPLTPTPLVIAEARDHFADHCAVCHANNGSGRTIVNAGLYPPAPDLRASGTQNLTDGELFYIIRDGIRFTGMPGWGGDDGENWSLVLFIRHLPRISPKELELMKEVNGLETEPNESVRHR